MAQRSSTLESESTLLAAARGGCTDAFAQLYERYLPLAVSVARRSVGVHRSWLAEDVAQTAFLEVFGALRNGAGPVDQLRPYLVTAVRRHAMRVGPGPVQAASPMLEDLVDDRPILPPDPDGQLGGHTLLEEAFGELPLRSQKVLWATEVQGTRAADVAELLDVPTASVYVLRHRARRRLVRTYVASCARSAEADCRVALDEIAAHLGSSRAAAALASPPVHVVECSLCRDVLRGIDVGAS